MKSAGDRMSSMDCPPYNVIENRQNSSIAQGNCFNHAIHDENKLASQKVKVSLVLLMHCQLNPGVDHQKLSNQRFARFKDKLSTFDEKNAVNGHKGSHMPTKKTNRASSPRF